jgi:hypothetical protein
VGLTTPIFKIECYESSRDYECQDRHRVVAPLIKKKVLTGVIFSGVRESLLVRVI